MVVVVSLFTPSVFLLFRTVNHILAVSELQEALLLNALPGSDIVLCRRESEKSTSIEIERSTAAEPPSEQPAAPSPKAIVAETQTQQVHEEAPPMAQKDASTTTSEAQSTASPQDEVIVAEARRDQSALVETDEVAVEETSINAFEPSPAVAEGTTVLSVFDSSPKEIGIPIPDHLRPTSACLLFSDDNHRLAEWIAYHYYAMGLRNLVVSVDPRSKTRPTEILSRWRPYMNIAEWEHEQIDKISYLMVQPMFYESCSIYLQSQGASWTSYHDLDEFIVLNEDRFPDAEERMRQPNSLMSTFETLRQTDPHHSELLCNFISRSLVGCVESTPDEIAKDVPAPFDPLRFDTLHYRYKTARGNLSNGVPKSFVDLSRVNLENNTYAVHRVHDEHCQLLHPPPGKNVFLIHHYLGPWSAYARPNDERKGQSRNFQLWQYRSLLQSGGATDAARPWLKGFVDAMGLDVAQRLLEGAGMPPDAPEQDREAWSLSIDGMLAHANSSSLDKDWKAWVRDWLEARNVTIPESTKLNASAA